MAPNQHKWRADIALILFCCSLNVVSLKAQQNDAPLPDAPFASWLTQDASASADRSLWNPLSPPTLNYGEGQRGTSFFDPVALPAMQPRAVYVQERPEPFHWKGLLLQSFAFQSLENGVRVMTANQVDRQRLLDKPFWANYWASLQQFNMRRWNDGDDFVVNYVGHPAQGAITGYLQIQNDPRGRALKLSRDKAYWRSRWRAFWWSTIYSTNSEIGPIGEAAIFSEGGATSGVGCNNGLHSGTGSCHGPGTKYSNNTGWVDFIITPVVGTLGLIGEDAVDRYITDPLVLRHRDSIKFKILRGTLNPPRTLANLLQGRLPWYRDYEHPTDYVPIAVKRFEKKMDREPTESREFGVFYSSLGLGTNRLACTNCRTYINGLGAEAALRVTPYLDVVASVDNHAHASPVASMNVGGSLVAANFGLRSGYSGAHFAAKLALKPGFASYSRVQGSNGKLRRNFNFSTALEASADTRVSRHLALRVTVEQLLIRYKNLISDPPGIGTPPDLSFLSHENFINSTNWGIRVGPVLRF